MIAKTPWTARKFNFDYPVSHFPVIYVRLYGTADRIEALIKNFTEEQLEQKPGGKWSVKEHVGHLTDLEELHEGRLDDYKKKVETLRSADMTNQKTNEAHHNSFPVARLMNGFRKSRNSFLEKIEGMNEEELNQSAMHPRLNQPMRLVDMTFFVAEHDDQHLATMLEILSTSGSDQ